MRRAGMLFEVVRERSSIAFLLNVTANGDSTGPEVVRVLSRRVARVYDPETKRSREALPVTSQLGEQTARTEIEGMPELGWAVDTQAWTCPCNYWAKFGTCIHTLLAKHVRGVHALKIANGSYTAGPTGDKRRIDTDFLGARSLTRQHCRSNSSG
ncbi:hypothetical protein PHYSODRAFT_299721 [Phytophthora sojae]|uniref:SWIM-type domain-containing protein n=1 Tax=Phytophthora sojae (strain P6497) TaxID=1094619 RepID=G4Z6F8_PHYSP|nr:hypothetical protein PHYSODRAFT_299721 [Phytophthora sojae]EGZ22406.1 hypothetical protein PHYSODRAFT_299721 [Phytophthora sojae]|eukprot:XP_009525123.1 hypothetical protein PHYSODRAFT_299721 [Phytophthora sojae]